MHNPEHLRPAHSDQTVILVVDDDVLVQNIVRIILEKEGYFVLTAENGEEALYISRKYPGPIHLVVSDVIMPKMDGLALREQITKERIETRVLLMSGETPNIGTGPFLRKPFGPKELLSKTHEIIKDPPSR